MPMSASQPMWKRVGAGICSSFSRLPRGPLAMAGRRCHAFGPWAGSLMRWGWMDSFVVDKNRQRPLAYWLIGNWHPLLATHQLPIILRSSFCPPTAFPNFLFKTFIPNTFYFSQFLGHMSASFLLLRNSFPSSSQQNTDCDSCLSYDAQTCCLVILPTAAATGFFVWLFFQKGHLAVGLVLAQLLAIVLLGVLAFLLAVCLLRCWRRLKVWLLDGRPKSKCSLVMTESGAYDHRQQQQPMMQQVRV